MADRSLLPKAPSGRPAAIYAAMQRRHYDEAAETVEELVGWYDFHENVPYETLLLHRYGDGRRPLLEDLTARLAFDIGCGEGRMIRRMSHLFQRVDGCDISSRMVNAAKERCPGSVIYQTDGLSCGDAPSNTYDFAYSTICLQHIAVHETRTAMLHDAARVLKPGGAVTIQMLYSRNYPHVFERRTVEHGALLELFQRDAQHATWFENRYGAPATNSCCDVVIGRDEIGAVLADFGAIFDDVSCWFHDISLGRSDPRSAPRRCCRRPTPTAIAMTPTLARTSSFCTGPQADITAPSRRSCSPPRWRPPNGALSLCCGHAPQQLLSIRLARTSPASTTTAPVFPFEGRKRLPVPAG